MPHPAIVKDNVAVITGGASGIGFAAALAFARDGMKVCIADVDQARLAEAATKLSSVTSATHVMTFAVDVSKAESVTELERAVRERFGGTDILMNNAGIQPGSTLFGEPDNWQRIIGVNMWGIINGSRIFAPDMIARGKARPHHQHRLEAGHHHAARRSRLQRLQGRREGFYGSAPARAAQHADCRITAHLLIPGFVFTGLTAKGRTEKPAGAWTAEQTVDFMLARLEAGDFYILCPDNDVPRALDEKRMLWAAGDIVENRPPLSRWHPDYADAFAKFVKGE